MTTPLPQDDFIYHCTSCGKFFSRHNQRKEVVHTGQSTMFFSCLTCVPADDYCGPDESFSPALGQTRQEYDAIHGHGKYEEGNAKDE